MWFSGDKKSNFVCHSWSVPMMKITGLSHLFKWENLHNWWLTKYFFAPLYMTKLYKLLVFISCPPAPCLVQGTKLLSIKSIACFLSLFPFSLFSYFSSNRSKTYKCLIQWTDFINENPQGQVGAKSSGSGPPDYPLLLTQISSPPSATCPCVITTHKTNRKNMNSHKVQKHSKNSYIKKQKLQAYINLK